MTHRRQWLYRSGSVAPNFGAVRVGRTNLDLFSSIAASRQPWMDEALCAQVGWQMFFPSKGQPAAPAKRVCQMCPVQVECLQFALDHAVAHGIWGGTSEADRRRLAWKATPALTTRVRAEVKPKEFYDQRARQIQSMAARGMSTQGIATELGLSRSAVQRALARDVKGEVAA